jgi:SAM-dependent methyltransferase
MTCPICKGSLARRATVKLPAGAIHRCRSCGAGVLWPRPDQTALSATHDDDSYFNHPYFEARRDSDKENRTFDQRVARLRLLMKNGRIRARVLDLGCDTGAFMSYLEARTGAEAIGVDVSRAAIAEGKSRGRDVRLGTLEAQRFPAASFDALTAFDVVEHVADPRALAQEVGRILKPGAPFVAEVPHYDGLVYRLGRVLGSIGLLGGPLAAIRDRLWPMFHVQYPNERALRILLGQAGFRDLSFAGRELTADELALGGAILRPLVLALFRLAQWSGMPTVLIVTARAGDQPGV